MVEVEGQPEGGIAAPAGVSREIVGIFGEAIKKAINNDNDEHKKMEDEQSLTLR